MDTKSFTAHGGKMFFQYHTYSIYTVDEKRGVQSLPVIVRGYFCAMQAGKKMRDDTGKTVVVRNTRRRTNVTLSGEG